MQGAPLFCQLAILKIRTKLLSMGRTGANLARQQIRNCSKGSKVSPGKLGLLEEDYFETLIVY